MDCLKKKVDTNVSSHSPLQQGGAERDGNKEDALPAGDRLLRLVCAVEGKKSRR